MITISEVVTDIIKNSPLLEDLLKNDLINYSAFARMYKKQIEEQLMKPVQYGAIVMSLKRISQKINKRKTHANIFQNPPEMMVRSHLFEVTIKHTPTLSLMQQLGSLISSHDNYFCTITEGVFETTIIASNSLKKEIIKKIPKNMIISEIDNLSAITIKLPKENIKTPGVYYTLLKALAWEDINLIEVVSTTNENTIILSEEDIDRAFSLLKNLFKSLSR